MKNDKDAQFLCKDCVRFNLCKYYDRRKEDSYICKYFHLSETYEMTNGEVIQALFPNCVKDVDNEGWFITNIDGWTAFTPKWWNEPYQKGGE